MHCLYSKTKKYIISSVILSVLLLTNFTLSFGETNQVAMDAVNGNKMYLSSVLYGLILSKSGNTDLYVQSDLIGDWYSVGLRTPAVNATPAELVSNYGVENGTMTVQSDGTYEWVTNDDSESGSLSISATGSVTDAGADDILGWYMNSSKDVMVVVFDNTADHEQGTVVFMKYEAAYVQSDLTGNWNSVGIITPTAGATSEELSSNCGVENGVMTVQSDGTYEWVTNDDADSGTLSISATGSVTDVGADDILGWYMNGSKDVMTVVFDNIADHEQGTIIFMKSGGSYVQSDLTGDWNSVGIITPTADATPAELVSNYGVENGAMTVQSDGTYEWFTNDDSESGTLSISATGSVTDVGADDVLGWYMNAGKNVMSLVFANTTDDEQGTITFVKKN